MDDCAELDKNLIGASFGQAAQAYDQIACQQQQIGTELLSQINATVSLDQDLTLLDVGCGTGFCLNHLLQGRSHLKAFGLDLSLGMCQQAGHSMAADVPLICADAKAIPLQDACVDMIVSNLALQWCSNLALVMQEFRRILKPQGVMFFSTFASATLNELRTAWQAVDEYSHVNQFLASEKIRAAVLAADFERTRFQVEHREIVYSDIFALMRELKGVGAHNVTRGRSRSLMGRGRFQALQRAYPCLNDSNKISATYELVFISAHRSAFKQSPERDYLMAI